MKRIQIVAALWNVSSHHIVLNRMWSQQICFLKCFKSPCSKKSNIQISSYSLNSFCNYFGLKRSYMTSRNRKIFHALGGYHLFTFLYERSIQFRNLYDIALGYLFFIKIWGPRAKNCSMMFLQEDVQIIKKMGFDFYRFSISWPRILPSKKTQLHSSIFEMFIDLYLNSNDKVR